MCARLTLLCLLLPAIAHGHGTIPAVTDIRVRPGDTSTLFIETNFGALLSTDGGAHSADAAPPRLHAVTLMPGAAGIGRRVGDI